ncbi:C1 family peptidase [Kolteria novifilia]
MGWIPDLPDPRDYTHRQQDVHRRLTKLKNLRRRRLPAAVDLRRDEGGYYFTPPRDQGPLNASTAFAVLSLVEYFERRVCGRTFQGSSRFLYKVTRNRLRMSGDTGADLRTTLKVLTQFGVPPEEHWPYDIHRFDDEPSSFLYSLAKPFAEVVYFRLDPANQDGTATWSVLQSFLAAGFPVVFGFPVPSSLSPSPDIHYRPSLDRFLGGQAALAVGYQCNHYGRGKHAILIRSSWGCQWGDRGYGWLPVGYVLDQLASDCWGMLADRWLDGDEFVAPQHC